MTTATAEDIRTTRPSVQTNDANQEQNRDCRICGTPIFRERYDIGKRVCLECGEEQAREERLGWCVVPISNKAGYTRVTDFDLLKQINPKRTET
jgi:ribosomal protein L37E